MLMMHRPHQSSQQYETHIITDQERFLPISNIARIMKRRVPEPNKISKEAKEGAQEACSEFVHFLVSEAVERCQTEKRKTIGGDDILLAMNALGFDSYLMPLKHYLERYRQAMRGADAKDIGGGVHDDDDDDEQAVGGGQAIVMDDQQQHDELIAGEAQMVQIQMASPGGTITTRTVPLVSYVDPATGQTYITLHTDAIQTGSGSTTVRIGGTSNTGAQQ